MSIIKIVGIVITAAGAALLVSGWRSDRFLWIGVGIGALGLVVVAVG